MADLSGVTLRVWGCNALPPVRGVVTSRVQRLGIGVADRGRSASPRTRGEKTICREVTRTHEHVHDETNP